MQSKLADLGWIEMEAFEHVGIPYPALLPPGAGLTNFIVTDLGETPFVVLSIFTEVGDNTVLAKFLANSVSDLLSMNKTDVWSVPVSWKVLYGPDTEIRELF